MSVLSRLLGMIGQSSEAQFDLQAFALHLPCICLAFALHLPCICLA
jgi:hypothetical protein